MGVFKLHNGAEMLHYVFSVLLNSGFVYNCPFTKWQEPGRGCQSENVPHEEARALIMLSESRFRPVGHDGAEGWRN